MNKETKKKMIRIDLAILKVLFREIQIDIEVKKLTSLFSQGGRI